MRKIILILLIFITILSLTAISAADNMPQLLQSQIQQF